MARRSTKAGRFDESRPPSDAEWKVLHALWRGHPATARELLERLHAESWAYTTVRTLLARMLEKGLVQRRTRGGITFYEPRIDQRSAERGALRALLERVFEGAAGPLLAHLAEERALSEADSKKLRRWIAELDKGEARRGHE